MKEYCVSTESDEYRVHLMNKKGALDERCIPYEENRYDLGEHQNIQEATEAARKIYPGAVACKECEYHDKKTH